MTFHEAVPSQRMQREPQFFSNIFVLGKHIRSVQLPEDVGVASAMDQQIEKIKLARSAYSRSIRVPKPRPLVPLPTIRSPVTNPL
jgi:hypothetical protein